MPQLADIVRTLEQLIETRARILGLVMAVVACCSLGAPSVAADAKRLPRSAKNTASEFRAAPPATTRNVPEYAASNSEQPQQSTQSAPAASQGEESAEYERVVTRQHLGIPAPPPPRLEPSKTRQPDVVASQSLIDAPKKESPLQPVDGAQSTNSRWYDDSPADPAEDMPLPEVENIAREVVAADAQQCYDVRGTLPFAPTTSQLNVQVLPSIRRAYALGQRGALYASRAEFIAVLQRVATTKDIEEGTNVYSRSLAEGLRAIDEAGDFVPRGIQLEAEVDVRAIASSHHTPVLKNGSNRLMPHQAVALYHAYAQQKLGEAVAGEQAGSMALHGLGRISARQAEQQEGNDQAILDSMTMYQAAIVAHPENHLAANELGVILARNGHYAQAEAMFGRVVQLAPSATAYHNLAVVQQQLGKPTLAASSEQLSQQWAHWEQSQGAVSRRKGIEWVTPEQMARNGNTRTADRSTPPPPQADRRRFASRRSQSPVMASQMASMTPPNSESLASRFWARSHSAAETARSTSPTAAAETSLPQARQADQRSGWRRLLDKTPSLPKPRWPWADSEPEREPIRIASPLRHPTGTSRKAR